MAGYVYGISEREEREWRMYQKKNLKRKLMKILTAVEDNKAYIKESL